MKLTGTQKVQVSHHRLSWSVRKCVHCVGAGVGEEERRKEKEEEKEKEGGEEEGERQTEI